jgi:hypothetical protein
LEAFENTKIANTISINPPSPAATAGVIAEKKTSFPAPIRLTPIAQKTDLPYILAKTRERQCNDAAKEALAANYSFN